jgi:hypothetical protein
MGGLCAAARAGDIPLVLPSLGHTSDRVDTARRWAAWINRACFAPTGRPCIRKRPGVEGDRRRQGPSNGTQPFMTMLDWNRPWFFECRGASPINGTQIFRARNILHLTLLALGSCLGHPWPHGCELSFFGGGSSGRTPPRGVRRSRMD